MVPACRFCSAVDGDIVLDLGEQPPCGVFPRPDHPLQDPRHPLRMWFCHRCGLAQLVEDPGVPETSSLVVELDASRSQTQSTLDFATDVGAFRPGCTVVEFGSPHGASWLAELVRRGARPVEGRGDVVFDVYGLLHEPDQAAALAARADAVGDGGALVVQMHSLAPVLEHREYGELRHAHFAYWATPVLNDALATVGLGVHRARVFPYDRGTVVLVVTRDPEPDGATLRVIEAESAAGVTSVAALRALQAGADRQSARLRTWLDSQIRAGRRVAAYGAASRVVPVFCYAGVDRDRIVAVADAAPSKQGRRMPGTDIPIVAPDRLRDIRPDQVLVTVPDLLDEIRAALPFVEQGGGSWVAFDPSSGLEPAA